MSPLVKNRCPRCDGPRIEIERFGERLIGCTECKRWTSWARVITALESVAVKVFAAPLPRLKIAPHLRHRLSSIQRQGGRRESRSTRRQQDRERSRRQRRRGSTRRDPSSHYSDPEIAAVVRPLRKPVIPVRSDSAGQAAR